VQGSRQKYVIWPCCIIFLVLIGFAFFYGILHQLGYQDKNLPPLPELVAFTSLIVIAPLVTFVIFR
ncbi:MAG TPA: hypothetical protein VFV38_16280, partial [Ktedonobacteraceae bacterium]|nr:hypothetical protein [Ktedonobacteraceae bacterium]